MSDWKMKNGGEEKEELRELLCLDLGFGCLGIELEHISEIIREWRTTPLPNVPEYFEGVFNRKGFIMPLVSLETLAGGRTEKPGGGKAFYGAGDSPFGGCGRQEGNCDRQGSGCDLPAGKKIVHRVVIALKSGEYECGFLAPEEPRLLGVRESERLQGSIPELFGGSIVIKSAYASEERVISVMDVEATLENLVIYL